MSAASSRSCISPAGHRPRPSWAAPTSTPAARRSVILTARPRDDMEQWLHMQPPSRRPIRVLVVDDSAFMRSTIARLLEGDPEFQVVGNASDGLEAIEKVEQLGPDVVTMDVEMPRMTGIEALDVIMHRVPTPVVMLSVFTTSGASTTIDALAKGAIDFVTKPSRGPWGDVDSVTDELKEKLRRAASISPMRLHLARAPVSSPPLVE